MKSALTLTMVALFSLTAIAPPADAKPRRGSDNASQEQNLLLRAQWDQARRVGGYPDPITFLISVFNGDPIEGAIQPVIRDPDPNSVKWPAPPGPAPK